MKTYLWMVVFLAINWGGFAALLVRTMRRVGTKGRDRDC